MDLPSQLLGSGLDLPAEGRRLIASSDFFTVIQGISFKYGTIQYKM